MDLHAFMQDYFDSVYRRCDADAAERFIADPCVRHECGHRDVLTLRQNTDRIADFLQRCQNMSFSNPVVVAEGEIYGSSSSSVGG